MYDETFKEKLLEEKRNSKISCEELAKKYNVAVQSVYAWVREDRKNRMQAINYNPAKMKRDELEAMYDQDRKVVNLLKESLNRLGDENTSLKEEISKLQEENEALKKTIEIFFKEKK